MPMLANTDEMRSRVRVLAKRLANTWAAPVVAVLYPPPKAVFDNDFPYVVQLASATKAELAGGEVIYPESLREVTMFGDEKHLRTEEFRIECPRRISGERHELGHYRHYYATDQVGKILCFHKDSLVDGPLYPTKPQQQWDQAQKGGT